MSVARILFVHALIAALVVPSLYDTFSGEEHWPYSPYPMYSRIAAATPPPRYHLYGVTLDDPPAEIRLPERSYAGPLNPLRLQAALSRLAAGEQPEASLRAVLRNFLERYEAERQRSAALPGVRGVRLYLVDGRRDGGPREGPPGRLVAEVSHATEGP